MHGVDGKVVIVTGSGKGIGKGMALHLGKGGARIVVAEWKDELMAADVRASSTSWASRTTASCATSSSATRSTRWSRRRSSGSAASTG